MGEGVGGAGESGVRVGAPGRGEAGESGVRVVVLVGPPGAGKTRVGSLLAERLGWGFVDTDEMVAERAGMSVADVFATAGEAQFRVWEREAVRDAIVGVGLNRGGGARVVAVGGGAPMDPESRALLAEPVVVFLDVSDAEGVRRVGLSGVRPLLVGSPRARWRALMAERRPVYAGVADAIVQTDRLTPGEVAARIAKLAEDMGDGKGLFGGG
jgi:shikimate kinase